MFGGFVGPPPLPYAPLHPNLRGHYGEGRLLAVPKGHPGGEGVGPAVPSPSPLASPPPFHTGRAAALVEIRCKIDSPNERCVRACVYVCLSRTRSSLLLGGFVRCANTRGKIKHGGAAPALGPERGLSGALGGADGPSDDRPFPPLNKPVFKAVGGGGGERGNM